MYIMGFLLITILCNCIGMDWSCKLQTSHLIVWGISSLNISGHLPCYTQSRIQTVITAEITIMIEPNCFIEQV